MKHRAGTYRLRVGAGHELEFGRWYLSTEFSLDFVDGEVNKYWYLYRVGI